jgi:PelA/Pel-15E family pectate lyase
MVVRPATGNISEMSYRSKMTYCQRLKVSPTKHIFTFLSAATLLVAGRTFLSAQDSEPANIRWGGGVLSRDAAWYATASARAVADSMIQYQSPQGGWPKATDLARPPRSAADIPAPGSGRANTFDNGGTTIPMEFLARIITASNETRYVEAFNRGLDYMFAAQYPNGGWPQFYPLREGYYSHITYNDGAMIRVLTVLRGVAQGRAPYAFVDAERRTKAAAAVARGIECILRTQVKQAGKLTVWCAQHDRETLAPAWARNYEIPSLSGAESVGIVRFLMEIDSPTPEIIAAVEGAVAWFHSAKVTGLRYQRGRAADGQRDGWVEPDPKAEPLLARFYELDSNRPIFAGRDKVIHYTLAEIERERRAGYAYYSDWPASLVERDYPKWRAKHKLPPRETPTASERKP